MRELVHLGEISFVLAIVTLCRVMFWGAWCSCYPPRRRRGGGLKTRTWLLTRAKCRVPLLFRQAERSAGTSGRGMAQRRVHGTALEPAGIGRRFGHHRLRGGEERGREKVVEAGWNELALRHRNQGIEEELGVQLPSFRQELRWSE